MKDRINQEQVNDIAKLAKLTLNKEEVNELTTQFNNCLGLFDKLEEVDTEEIEPTYSTSDALNVYRDDKSDNWHQQDFLLKNAPKVADNEIVVPPMVNREEK